MNRFLWFVVAIVGIVAVVNYQKVWDFVYTSPCNTPLRYKIGSIDSRFNVTEETLKQNAAAASKIWSDVYGKTLFVYDPNANLTIKMDYDARQTLAKQIDDLTGHLADEKSNIDPKEREYNARAASFEAKAQDLNSRIDYWNSRGGAPEEEYKKLIEEQNALRAEAQELNQLARSLNLSTQAYNNQISQLNTTVKNFNSAIKVRPEEGLYSGLDDTITLYFSRGNQAMTHTLAHEMGHALGMEHVSNKNAIMYSQTNDVTAPSKEDLKELEIACEKEVIAQTWLEKLIKLVQQLKVKYIYS